MGFGEKSPDSIPSTGWPSTHASFVVPATVVRRRWCGVAAVLDCFRRRRFVLLRSSSLPGQLPRWLLVHGRESGSCRCTPTSLWPSSDFAEASSDLAADSGSLWLPSLEPEISLLSLYLVFAFDSRSSCDIRAVFGMMCW